MHVVLLKAQSKSKGGLEKYANRIAASFVQKGAEVTCLTTQIPEKKEFGVDYYAFPVCPWPGFLRLEQFDRCVRRHLRKLSADIVFGMDRNRMQTHIRAGNGVHAAYLKSRFASEGWAKYWLCHLNPLHKKILEIEKDAFESPSLKKIFVNSRMVRENLLGHYAVDPSKIEVIHNGVEWKEFEVPFSESVQKRLLVDKGRFQLLFIGNGYRRKGLGQLLQALSLWKFKDFELSVVGKDKDIEKYRASLEKLGLRGRVHFFGVQNEIIPFYQMADVLAIPSFYDPFANVTLEALSFGLYVISSKTNGGSEILGSHNGTCIDNLLSPEAILSALDLSLKFKKTPESAAKIRESVSHLDFSLQLSKLIDACV